MVRSIRLFALLFWVTTLLVGPHQSQAATTTPPLQGTATVAQGVATERTDLRSRNALVYQFADGSGYAKITSSPVNYRADDGTWQPIDTQLVATATGWANATNDVKLQFQTRSSGQTRAQSSPSSPGLVSLSEPGRSLQFEPLGASRVAARVAGSRITYANAFEGVDLEYHSTPGQVKETLVLHKLPIQAEFSFELRATGITPQLEQNGGLSFAPCTDTCWLIMPPYMEDAAGASSDAIKVRLEDVGNGSYALTYTPDTAWLTDASRVWPVMLDPTVNTSGGVGTYVQQGNPDLISYNQRYTAVGYDPENTGKAVTRSFFSVGLPTLPSGSKVSNATFNFYQYYRLNAANSYTGQIRRVTTEWASRFTTMTWNNQPSTDGTAVASRNVDGAIGWKDWNITSLVQQWYGGTPNYGLGVFASPESTRGSYFCSVSADGAQCNANIDASQLKPYIIVTFTTGNIPPNVPGLVAPAEGATTSAAGVTLQAQDAGDPDNGPRNYRDFFFQIQKTDGSSPQESGWRDATWGVTLPAPGNYRWRARADDGADGSAWSAWRGLSYYVPPSTPRLTINPNSVDLNTNTTVLLEGVPAGQKVRLISSRGSADAFGMLSGTADAFGRFSTTLRSGSVGTGTVTAKNETTNKDFGVSAQISFKTPPPQPKLALITGVKTTYPLDARYLQGIPVNNTIEATLDWKGGSAGRAALVINGRVIQMQLSGNTARATINMGGDLGSGRNAMRIAAYDSASQLTDYRDFAPWSTPLPVWMAGLRSFGLLSLPVFASGSSSAKGLYKAELSLATVSIRAPRFGIDGLNTQLDWSFKSGLEYPFDCESDVKGYVSSSFGSKFKFVDADINASINLGIKGKREGCGIPDPSGFFGVSVDGRKTLLKKPFLVVVSYINPGFGTTLDNTVRAFGLEGYAGRLGEVYLDGKVKFSAEASINFTSSKAPYFEVSDIELEGGLGLELGYRTNIQEVLELRAWVGADGSIKFGRKGVVSWPPTNGLTFDSIKLNGEIGAFIKVSAFGRTITEREVKGGVEWKYPRDARALADDPTIDGEFRPISHPSARNYARFQAVRGTQQAFGVLQSSTSAVGMAQPTVSPLATNVYTYTEPTLAINPVNGNGMLLWVHDDINKPVGQSHELKFSLWNGTNWSAPANVTNDNVIDEAPQVTWDVAGNAVAVWSRMSEPMAADSTWNEQTAKKTEIGTATYSVASGTWSTPIKLTVNDALDMTPRIARNANGEVIATWRQNSAGLLSGDETNPDRIMVARMNRGVWLAPTVAVDSIAGLADLSIGTGTGTTTIAYTRFLVATGAPSATLQLFTSTQTNGAWATPIQLTDDQLGHRNPRVVYNAANQPLLIWLAGQELRLRNLVTNETRALTVPADVGGIDEFRVVQDAAGNLAAVFTAQTGQRDLWVSFYDSASALWGLPTRLTDNRASESYPAAAMDRNGRLLLAYSSTAVTSQQRTAIDPATGQTLTYTIPVEGQTDLMTLAKTFARNLTITDQQLTISDEHPAPGATIRLSATVTNTGDLPLSNVAVQFSDGNPAAGGLSIGRITLPGQLAAGYTATLAINYTVPSTGLAREIYATADPDGVVGETDETDNVARRLAFGPDLEIVYAEAEPWSGSNVGLRSIIRNVGTAASPATVLSYLRENITGAVLASEPLPSLAVGQSITLTTAYDYGGLSRGSYTLVAAVNQSSFAETFKANNSYTTTLAVQPDLLVTGDNIQVTAQAGASSTIAATIYNNGSVTATNAKVGVYRRGTLDQPALLFVRTLPDLPPGASAVITGPVNGELGCGLFVAANPDQALPETTYVNNLASVVQQDGYCANFVYTPTSGITGTAVNFTDTSSGNVTTWQWEFGDGTTSNERNPMHIYDKPGSYDVTLRISGADGKDEFKREGAVVVYKDPGKVDIFLPLTQR